MNIFVVLLVTISLGGSVWIGFEPIDDWLERTMAVAATAAMVPAIALFQCGMVVQRFQSGNLKTQEFESTYRRMTVAHALVWLTASASIIWVLRWQDVVRGSWQMGNWPLLDELLILLPGTLGMIASWLVFFELQNVLVGSTADIRPDGRGQGIFRSTIHRLELGLKPRWNFIATRFRVYFLIVLAPLAIVLLSIDLFQSRGFESSALLQCFGIIGGFVLAMAWPFVLSLIWNTEAIHEPILVETRSSLRELEIEQLRFHRWNTGGQLANAVVAGWLPRMRYIFLSDVILDKFPRSETEAIVRHEMGHIRRNHAWWRLVLLMLPLMVLSIHQSWLNGMATVSYKIELVGSSWDFEVAPAWVAFLVLLAGAAWWSNRWLSHQMEYDADLEAIQSYGSLETGTLKIDVNGSSDPLLDRKLSNGMREALWRLAAYAGDDWKRATWFHPSIRARLEFLDRIEAEPAAAMQFRTWFSAARWRLLWGWLTVAAAGLIVALSSSGAVP